MDFSRLRQGEIIAGIAGVALFVFMFLDWFEGGAASAQLETEEIPGLGEVPTGVGTEAEGISAWDALQDFSGFLIALAAVSGVALTGLAAAGRRVNVGDLPRGCATAALGSLAVALILWRMLANPGDLEFGIFLGLAAAIAIAVGATLALREGGFEPLVAAGGGARRSSGAGRTTTTRRAAASRSSRSSSGGSRSGGASRSRAKRSGGGSRSGAKRSSGSRSRSSSRKSSSSRKK